MSSPICIGYNISTKTPWSVGAEWGYESDAASVTSWFSCNYRFLAFVVRVRVAELRPFSLQFSGNLSSNKYWINGSNLTMKIHEWWETGAKKKGPRERLDFPLETDKVAITVQTKMLLILRECPIVQTGLLGVMNCSQKP